MADSTEATGTTEVLYEHADGDWGVTLRSQDKEVVVRLSDLSAGNQSFIRFLVAEARLPLTDKQVVVAQTVGQMCYAFNAEAISTNQFGDIMQILGVKGA